MKTHVPKLAALTAACVLAFGVAQPAHALFGIGDIVLDPTNLIQNTMTAARTLEQINNQIRSLQNEAQMLINQGKNLASLPYSALAQLQQSIQKTQALLADAQSIAYDVQQIDQAFQKHYAHVDPGATDQQLLANAKSRWQTSVAALQDAMRVQAGIVQNLDASKGEMAALIGESQGASGELQATQAGNQILALQAQQLADLTAVTAANGRAQALQAAEQAAAAEQGREHRKRFLTLGTQYQPGHAKMFYE